MAITRIKNNQITDLTVNAATKLQDFSITSAKISNNLTYNSSLTIAGNLTVQGNVTAIDTHDLVVEDPLILLAKDQTGSPTLDIGFIGERGDEINIAFVWDESADEFATTFTNDALTNTTITISSYAPLHTGNLLSGNANITGTLDIGGNVTFSGSIVGDVTVTGNVDANNFNATNTITAAAADVSGNIDGANLNATTNVTGTTFTASGNVNANNVVSTNDVTTATVTASGNVSGGNLVTAGDVTTATVTASGNVSGGNLVTAGDVTTATVTASGNVNGANVNATTNVTGTTFTASGNVNANNAVITNGVSATTVSATGNVSGGNVISSALVQGVTVTASGNLNGNNAVVTNDVSAATVTASGNISGGNLVTAGDVTTATVTASGNVSGGNLVSAADVTTATVTASGNVNGANVNATTNVTGTTFTASGNVNANNAVITNNVGAATVTASGNIDGANVNATTNVTGTTFTASGNVNANNVVSTNDVTTATVTASGNVSGANLNATTNVTGTTFTASGNVNANNAVITNNVGAATMTASGNISGSNLNASADVVATGNLNGNNAVITNDVSSTTVTATGNISGGNLAVTGMLQSATLETTGNALIGGNLIVQGNITYINIDDLRVEDPIIVLGTGPNGDPLSTDDGMDRGVFMEYYTSALGNAFVGWQNTSGNMIIANDVEFSGNNLVGVNSYGTLNVGNLHPESVSLAGNINTGNLIATGLVQGATVTATGNLNGNNAVITNDVSSTTVTASGNVNGANLNATTNVTGTTFTASGNVNANNVVSTNDVTTATLTASGNVSGANVNATSAMTAGTTITATGNITGGNLITSNGVFAGTGFFTGNVDVLGNLNATIGVVYANSGIFYGDAVTGNNAAFAGIPGFTQLGSNVVMQFAGNVNSYSQINFQNINAGNIASTDFIVTADNGDDANYYGDFGINSSTFDDPVDYPGYGPNDTYLHNHGGNLILNPETTGKTIKLMVGGTDTSDVVAEATATSFDVTGNISATGYITSTGNVIAGNVVSNAAIDGTTITASGNVNANNVVSTNDVTTATVTASGNVNGANLNATTNVTGTTFTASGNVNANNVVSTNDVTTATVTASGNIDGANLNATTNVTGATITASGNVNANNAVITNNVEANNFTATGTVTTPNITSTGGLSITTASNGNITLNPNGSGKVILEDNFASRMLFTGADKEISTDANATYDGETLVITGVFKTDNVTIDGADITSNTSELTINGAGADVNFRVEGTTNANLLFVDAGTDTVVIGSATATAGATLKVGASDSMMPPVGNVSQRPGTPAVGMFRFSTTEDALEVYTTTNGWEVVGVPAFTVITADEFTGDGSTVQFILNADSTTAATIVSINGVVQIPTTAYSVSGNVLTFTEAPTSTDVIDARLLTTTTSVAAITNASGNAQVTVPDGGDVVIVGNIIPEGNVLYSLGNDTHRWVDLFLAGTSIVLGNIVIKNEAGNTIAFYGADGSTPATIDAVVNDSTKISSGTSEVSFAAADGNINLIAGGTTTGVITNTGANISGTINATGNANLGNLGTASIVATGTLGVTGNANLGNLGTASIVATGTLGVTGNANLGNLGTASIVATGTLGVTGNANVGNLGATSVAATNLTGTLQTAAQPNITSVGTLTSLAVAGNISPGGIAMASGNATIGNLYVSGTTTIAGNITQISGNSGQFFGNADTGFNALYAGLPAGFDLLPQSVTNFVSQYNGYSQINNQNQSNGDEATVDWVLTGDNGDDSTYFFDIGFSGSGYDPAVAVLNNALGNVLTPNDAYMYTTGNVAAGNPSNMVIGTVDTNSYVRFFVGGYTNDYTVMQLNAPSAANTVTVTGGITVAGSSGVAAITNGGSNGVGNIGSSSSYFNTIFAKATSAQYADLAEMYRADRDIEPGTVVCFGGAKEITVCDEAGSSRIAGVISTNPSYVMNAALDGEHVVAVALTGRVPTKVVGTVRKGDMMVGAGNGQACACASPTIGSVIGKALEDFDGPSGTIEIVVGRL